MDEHELSDDATTRGFQTLGAAVKCLDRTVSAHTTLLGELTTDVGEIKAKINNGLTEQLTRVDERTKNMLGMGKWMMGIISSILLLVITKWLTDGFMP